MKAERRHDLKENSLANRLVKVPSFGKTYGLRIAVGVALVGLISFIIYQRVTNSREQQLAVATSLLRARESVQGLKGLAGSNAVMFQAPEFIANQRNSMFDGGVSNATSAFNGAGEKDLSIRAQALICRADLNWEMANMPALMGASSKPSLQVTQPRADLLKQAEADYQLVVEKYFKEQLSLIAARFGLASIFEDRHEWDKAKEQYQNIADSDAPQVYRLDAKARMDTLAQLERPPVADLPSLTTRSSKLGPTTSWTSQYLTTQVSTRPATMGSSK